LQVAVWAEERAREAHPAIVVPSELKLTAPVTAPTVALVTAAVKLTACPKLMAAPPLLLLRVTELVANPGRIRWFSVQECGLP
jgi:hypothetical protein